MSGEDLAFETKARQAILAYLDRKRSHIKERIYLVSYPRSGSTWLRELFSILQGCPQYSVYADDVIGSTAAPLSLALHDLEIIKSHQMPDGNSRIIYLIRDGRNATLSFLYMTFLFGGHRFSKLCEVYSGIRYLDQAEGRWADHVAHALEESTRREILFVRYEDMLRDTGAGLARIAGFLHRELSGRVIGECLRRHETLDSYSKNPYSGYFYEPEKDSIYDILKLHRKSDYWRYILDGRSKRYFHEHGGTQMLLKFGYESSFDWWT